MKKTTSSYARARCTIANAQKVSLDAFWAVRCYNIFLNLNLSQDLYKVESTLNTINIVHFEYVMPRARTI